MLENFGGCKIIVVINKNMGTFYKQISKNKKTQRQVNAILVLEELKKYFESLNDEEKRKFINLLDE